MTHSPFGQQLQTLRRIGGLTQEALAARASCSVDTVKKLETGARHPSPKLADRLAAALGLAGSELAQFLSLTHPSSKLDDLWPMAHSRPAPLGALLPPLPLLGREQELHTLLRWLQSPNHRLITLIGPGGVGKTSLALHVATICTMGDAPLFAGTVALVALAPIATANAIPLAIAEALGLALQGMRPATEQILNALSTRTLLLIFDNCEHLIGLPMGETLTDVIRSILATAPGVHVLATSRERLRLREERVLEIGGLPAPATDVGPLVERSPAVQLFVERAQRLTPDFTLRGENHSAVAQICRRLEGLPLAIELVASWVRTLSPKEIATELRHSLDLLTSSERDIPTRHRSIRTVLDHSWALLSVDERPGLARLAIFSGGCDRAAAAEVAGVGMALLGSLIDKSLVRREEQRGTTRYTLHDLLRQYAAERLAENPDDLAATAARHRLYYAALLQRLSAPASASAPDDRRLALSRELENLRAAWSCAVTVGDTTTLSVMARGLWIVYEQRGWLHDGAVLFGAAAETLRQSIPEASALRSLALCLQGYFLVRTGHIATSRAVLEEGLACARLDGAADVLPQILYNLGIVAVRQGRIEEAAALLNEATTLATAATDTLLVLLISLYRSVLAKLAQDWPMAETLLKTSLATCRQQSYRRIEALIEVQLAELALYRDQDERIDAHLQAAMRIAGELQDQWVISMSLGLFAYIANRRGQRDEARYLLNEALTVMRSIGDLSNLGRTLAQQVEYDLIAGDLTAAQVSCIELIRIVVGGETLLAPTAAHSVARLFTAAGAIREAFGLLLASAELPGMPEAHRSARALREELAARLSPAERAAATAEARERTLLPWLEQLGMHMRRAIPPVAEIMTPAPPIPTSGRFIPQTGETLSEREVEVLRLLLSGTSNQQIADTLIISRHTVKHHVASILAKLQVTTRTAAALVGRELGLAPLSPHQPDS